MSQLNKELVMAFSGSSKLDFLLSVQKHGDHDQAEHGAWATGIMNDLLTLGSFDEESEYEGAMSTYSERYGVDNQGRVVGVGEKEAGALNSYIQSGYKRLNGYLREKTDDIQTSLTIAQATDIIENDVKFYQEALKQYQEKYQVSSSDMSENLIEEAIDVYASNNQSKLLDAYNQGKSPQSNFVKADIKALDKLIDESPSLFGDKTLFRVFSNNALASLKEGDIMKDKGFLSTTRIDVTRAENSDARTWLGDLNNTPDTVGVILPSESKSGKGLAVDIFKTAIVQTGSVAESEKEVLLPRDTPLKFIGYKTDVGVEARVAIFQRLDK